MHERTVTLQRTDLDDIGYVERLLDRNGLPTADVRDEPERFFVGFDGGDRVGVGGLEIEGGNGLLRSVVVEESVRGEGYGVALCDALEARARRAGVERLFLLTTTASEFFDGLGYETVERSDVPAAIRGTTEFENLCPDSATCLSKSL